MIEVLGAADFDEWFQSLDDADADAVARILDMLELHGPTLPYPYSSAINGSRHALRELRVQSGGRPLRIIYAFDRARRAILLLGGDKTGDGRFYRRLVPQAERLFEAHLKDTKQ